MKITIWFNIFLLSLSLASASAYSMNKGELIDAIAGDASISKADAGKALNALTKAAVQRLKNTCSTALPRVGRLTLGDLPCTRANKIKLSTLKLGNKAFKFVAAPRLMGDLVMTSYADSFFDSFTADLALNIEISFNRVYGPGDAHFGSKLKNSASYGRIISGYLETSRPVFIKYVECIVSAAQRGGDNNCNGIGDTLRSMLEPTIDEMINVSLYDEFTVKPIRIEIAIKDAVITALNAYLKRASKELKKSVTQGQGNGYDLNIILDNAARIAKITRAQMVKISDSFARVASNALIKGDFVSLGNFGRLSISKRAATIREGGRTVGAGQITAIRTGRNPQTGATIQIKARKVVKFKGAAAIKGGGRTVDAGQVTPILRGRNPQTGATIQIKARKVVKFKAGTALSNSPK